MHNNKDAPNLVLLTQEKDSFIAQAKSSHFW